MTAATDRRGDGEKSGKAHARLKSIIVDSSAMQGRREKQEDRHVKIPDLTKAARLLKMPIDHLEQPCALLAVYDGHQGHLCSEFVAKNFHLKLLQKLSAAKDPGEQTDKAISAALQQVCEELDADFLAKFRTAPDGCTVVVALVVGLRLFVAWAGDSRCLLCRHTSKGDIATVALTQDHRPTAPAEAERVKSAGGAVVNFDGAWRVAHVGFEERIREIRRARAQGLGTIGKEPVALAVSRSLGDRHFKAVTGKALLSATPSVQCVTLDPSCQFIALMCDGIPDVMRNEEIVFELDFNREADPVADVKAACGSLVQEAYKRGSEDNLTVVLARFQFDVPGGTRQVEKRAEASGKVEAKPTLPRRPAAASAGLASGATAAADAKDAAAEQPKPIAREEGESALDALKRKHQESKSQDDRRAKIPCTAPRLLEAAESSAL